MAVGRSRLLGNRGDAVDHSPTILYLKSEPDFLTLDKPLELARVCGKDLEIPLLHDDPVPAAVHHADFRDHFFWRRDEAPPA